MWDKPNKRHNSATQRFWLACYHSLTERMAHGCSLRERAKLLLCQGEWDPLYFLWYGKELIPYFNKGTIVILLFLGQFYFYKNKGLAPFCFKGNGEDPSSW